VGDNTRFGVQLSDLPVELEFGEWGVLETVQALDLFDNAHTYFDQEDVQKAEQARRAYIQAAWRYYDGHHRKPLVVKPGENDDNILLNYCRTIVDDSVAWLWGHPETGILQMQIDELGVPADVEASEIAEDATTTRLEAAIDLLNQVYRLSGGFPFFQRWGKNGTLAGHFFIKIVPQTGEIPARLVVLDPEMVSIMADPLDKTRALAYKIEWERVIKEPNGRKNTYLHRQLIVRLAGEQTEAWLVADFRAKKQVQRRKWELINGPFAWPWNWAPIVDGPNLVHGRQYWGLTDLEDITGINDAINFSASNTGRILKIHAHPKTIGTGFTAGELQDTSIDAFWTIPNADAHVQNLEMQSDLGAAQTFVESLRMSFWTIGRGLDMSVFRDKIGQVTNFALRVLAHRALTKNGDKRVLYGAALMTINQHLLEMAGFDGFITSIKWPDALPMDAKEVVFEQQFERTAGLVSKQTLAEERGRSWLVEQQRMEDEAQAGMNLGQFLVEQFDRGGSVDGDDDDEE